MSGGGFLAGVGLPLLVALLAVNESGIPILVPADLVMLLLGERASAGAFPLWGAAVGLEVAAVAGTTVLFVLARGPGRAVVARLGPKVGLTADRLARASGVLERRGRVAIAVGRATPGLRTLTVLAAGGSELPAGRVLPALVLGSSVFLQIHLVLGYVLGGAARNVLEEARGPLLIVLAAVAIVGVAVWLARRGSRRGVHAWMEASCPLCLAAGLLTGSRGAEPAGS